MTPDQLTAPMEGVDHREIGGVEIDVARAGDCRVKRVGGFAWVGNFPRPSRIRLR